MMELVRSGGMGDFKVLVQGKNVGEPELWGVVGGAPSQTAPPPLLVQRHMPLFEGRYPSEASRLEHLWPGGEEM